MTLPSGIPIDELDPGIRPQDDLFRHVNGRWLARTEIPADRARDSAFRILAEEAQTPEDAAGLVLNHRVRGELVGYGPGVARYLRWGGVDLVDEQGQGTGDAGLGGLGEGDDDRAGANVMRPAVPRMMVSRVMARYSSSSRR